MVGGISIALMECTVLDSATAVLLMRMVEYLMLVKLDMLRLDVGSARSSVGRWSDLIRRCRPSKARKRNVASARAVLAARPVARGEVT